jgi:hypothetical protein
MALEIRVGDPSPEVEASSSPDRASEERGHEPDMLTEPPTEGTTHGRPTRPKSLAIWKSPVCDAREAVSLGKTTYRPLLPSPLRPDGLTAADVPVSR